MHSLSFAVYGTMGLGAFVRISGATTIKIINK